MTHDSPRILILSASVGAGHGRAAEAIRTALEKRLPGAAVRHIDVLTLTNPVFQSAYRDGYFAMVEHAPHLVASIYESLDKPWRKGFGRNMRLLLQRASFGRLFDVLQEGWDLVINTHFLPPELIAYWRQAGRISCPQATVVTDFDVQALWINRPCEAYFVADRQAREYLMALGVEPSRAHVSGIPVGPVFAEPKPHDFCRKKHEFTGDRPAILMMASGAGFLFNDVERIYRSLQRITMPVQICIVTGNNKETLRRLLDLSRNSRHPCRIMGFTREMDELLIAADIIITKPGGLTVSEALARGCPMLLVTPIPGQEERNSDFLLQSGCALRPFHFETIGPEIERLFGEPGRLQAMKEAARRHGKPHAAEQVAERCIALSASANSHPRLMEA